MNTHFHILLKIDAMKSPITGVEMTLKREVRTMVFRKKEYQVQYHYYLCEKSKEQFTTTQLDNLNLTQVYNQYRDEHNLPFPAEIQEIRESYGLSAIKMAEVLGMGVNTYRNYEQGEVPAESSARLIQIAQNPEEFIHIVRLSEALQGKALEKLSIRIEQLIQQRKRSGCIDFEEYLLGSRLPDEYSGYKKPDLEKLRVMVIYFALKAKPWKVKLNKLLFYADFLNFKRTGYSISGTRYCAIPLGPVPDNHNSIFEYMEKQGDIRIETKEFDDGGIGEKFHPSEKRSFSERSFSSDELETLETVANAFGTTTTGQIIKISHEEPAWIENETDRKLISYQKYGFNLKAL